MVFGGLKGPPPAEVSSVARVEASISACQTMAARPSDLNATSGETGI